MNNNESRRTGRHFQLARRVAGVLICNCTAALFRVTTKANSQMSFGDSWGYAFQVSLYALVAVVFVENGSPADRVQFLPKQLNSSARRRQSSCPKGVNGAGCPKTWIWRSMS